MSEFQTNQRTWSHLEVAKLLTSQTTLTTLSIEDAQKIVQRMHAMFMKEGTVLVLEGTSTNNYMLLILSGEGVVENESLKKNESVILGVVGPGHIIGEMGLIDGEPRSATCTAFTDMEVAVLDRKALANLIEAEPTTGCKLLAALLQRTARRLRDTNKKLRLLTQINRTLEQEMSAVRPSWTAPRATPKAGINPDSPLML